MLLAEEAGTPRLQLYAHHKGPRGGDPLEQWAWGRGPFPLYALSVSRCQSAVPSGAESEAAWGAWAGPGSPLTLPGALAPSPLSFGLA